MRRIKTQLLHLVGLISLLQSEHLRASANSNVGTTKDFRSLQVQNFKLWLWCKMLTVTEFERRKITWNLTDDRNNLNKNEHAFTDKLPFCDAFT